MNKTRMRCSAILWLLLIFSTGAQTVVLTDWKDAKWSASTKTGATMTPAKTPEDSAAMTFKTTAKAKNIFRSPVLKSDILTGKKFDGFKFQVRNNGKPGMILFRFFGQDAKKQARIIYILPESNQWQNVTLPLNDQLVEMLDELKIFTIQVPDVCDFTLGPLSFQMVVGGTVMLNPMPKMYAPDIDVAPVIDGNLADKCWENIPSYSLEQRRGGGKVAEKTVFKLRHDQKNLYIAATLECGDISKLKADAQDYGLVFNDDTFEIVINDGDNLEPFRQFAVNSKGSRSAVRKYHDDVKDAVILDGNWKPDWQVKCRLSNNKWFVEAAIPLALLGKPREIMFGQIGRVNRVKNEVSSFSSTARFTEVKNCAALIMGKPVEGGVKNAVLIRSEKGKYSFSSDNKNQIALHAVSDTRTEFSAHGNADGMKFDYPSESNAFHFMNAKLADGSISVYRFDLILPMVIRYGDIILNPTVKQVKWLDGCLTLTAADKIYIPEDATPRTEKTAKMLAGELKEASGFDLPVVRGPATGGGISMTLGGSGAKEGYELEISERIVLRGNDEPGLHYAGITLMQILRGSMRITDSPELRKVKIKDWPDVNLRIISTVGNWKTYNPEEMDLAGQLRWYQDFFKRNVAGQKFNLCFFSVDYTFFFTGHPDVRRRNAKSSLLDKEFFKIIYQLCQDNFIELAPQMNWGGHFWINREKYGHLYEPGFKRQGDILAPGFWELYTGLVDEIITGHNIKYWNTMNDEWFSHHSSNITDTYKGIPRQEIFKQNILKQYNVLKERGIRPFMFGDMLLKSHNGDNDGPRKGLYQVASELPRDIYILNWTQQIDPTSNRTLHELGFPVINFCNGFVPCPQDRDFISGVGLFAYGLSHKSSGIINDTYSRQLGYSAHIRIADYAWNIKRDPGTSLRDFEREKMYSVSAMNSAKYNAAGGSRMTPLPLPAEALVDLKDITGTAVSALKNGEYGFVPMQMESGKVMALTEKNAPECTVGRKVAGFYVLQGAYFNPKERENLLTKWNKYLRGIPLAHYKINYADGTSAETSMRFGVNTVGATTPEPRSRYMSDCRYIWEGKDDRGHNFYLFQYEWVNPHPDKEVKSIAMTGAGSPGLAFTAAMTVRELKGTK